MPGTATTILIDGTPTDGSDPWIDSLVTGGAWKDSNGGTVTIQWTAFQGTMDGQNSYGWTSLALAGLREAMSLWESVANIDFVEVSGAANADVRFWWGTEAQAGGAGVLGWSDLVGFEDYYENPASETRDILFNAQDPAMSGALDDGGLGLVTMVHEIGHLLGLAHPHDGGAGSDATTFQGVNWWDPYNIGSGGLNQGVYTVMSYNFGWPSKVPDHTAESWGLTYGPMALDIAAIQEIYGANTTYASGDNVYVLPKTHGAGTYWTSIWDTGGIDTISAAGAPGVTTIDLRDPTDAYDGVNLVSFSYDVSGYIIEGGYTIARSVVIENAIGGNSNDRLYGNEVSNRLEGGNGADQLDGREGADTMIGGAGGDYYYVDDVGDLVIEFASGSNYDTVISTVDYTLREHVENLTLYPGYGPLNGRGNSSANVLTGTEDDNILEGAGGADTLDGKNGNDRLVVDDLSFAKVDGGEGIDTLALGGAGLVLDLTSLATQWKLWNLERIDLTGTGDNTLIVSRRRYIPASVRASAAGACWWSSETLAMSCSLAARAGPIRNPTRMSTARSTVGYWVLPRFILSRSYPRRAPPSSGRPAMTSSRRPSACPVSPWRPFGATRSTAARAPTRCRAAAATTSMSSTTPATGRSRTQREAWTSSAPRSTGRSATMSKISSCWLALLQGPATGSPTGLPATPATTLSMVVSATTPWSAAWATTPTS